MPSLLLLVSHSLARAFSGSGVGLAALASYGETLSMANTTVATDFDQSLDIKSDIAAQIAFYSAIMVNIFSEL